MMQCSIGPQSHASPQCWHFGAESKRDADPVQTSKPLPYGDLILMYMNEKIKESKERDLLVRRSAKMHQNKAEGDGGAGDRKETYTNLSLLFLFIMKKKIVNVSSWWVIKHRQRPHQQKQIHSKRAYVAHGVLEHLPNRSPHCQRTRLH